jgi:nucleoside-diphosphate-sugar epimerase
LSKILVTGGAGYIGSILVPQLIDEGHQVTVIDNYMYQQSSLAELVMNKNFKLEIGDVRDIELIKKHLVLSDIIIPLAAIVGAPACKKNPIEATSINKESILKLFEIVSSEQLVIMPTTNSAYGSGNEDNYCDEESPLNPLSLYAKDKVLVEQELVQLDNWISFRLATVFGLSPRMRLDLLVNNFVYRALVDKFIVLFESHFKRNYIHVRDVSNAFKFAIANSDKMKNSIFNIGLTEANISKMELCAEISKLVPDFVVKEEEFTKDPDQRNYIVSNSKIESLGFATQINLKSGIQELVTGIQIFKNFPYTNL